MEEYYIGQIFIEDKEKDECYPSAAAEWCNNTQGTDNPARIVEIPSNDGLRRFQIQTSKPSEQERKLARIDELQTYLNDTDWYCARYVDIGTPIPDDIKQQRSEARIEIDRLRHELEASEDTDTSTESDIEDENAVIEPMAEDEILANNSENEADDDTHNSED